MSERKLDVLFVESDSSGKAYQDLSKVFTAIETPTWSLLLAQSCRSKGFGVAILDCCALKINDEEAVKRIYEINPRLVVFVNYGQNPNSGTTSMIGSSRLAKKLKQVYPEFKVAFVGSHVSALPREVLSYEGVDIVLVGDGVYALRDLLLTNFKEDELKNIKGIGYKNLQQNLILNPSGLVVPHERMDIDLPGYAWDLLPYNKSPLDLYRSHFWHADFDHNKRTPFASIYTSLGCRFACDFCMINMINNNSFEENASAGNHKGMRYWSTDFMLKEIENLSKMGVQTLRISDEMFFLDKRYYDPLLTGIKERDLSLNMWAYSRVDTVRKDSLDLFKEAGVNWLALGIEAGNQLVRREVSKGSFKDVNIHEAVKEVRDSGISVISNYIFGFPDDNLDTMNQTLELALDLCTEMANMYPCQALPGSPIYQTALKNNWKLPDSHEGYAFLSYESEPLPTKHCSAAEVLKFRDEAWKRYFTYEPYLKLVETKFGKDERKNVEDMSQIQLKRKILGD